MRAGTSTLLLLLLLALLGACKGEAVAAPEPDKTTALVADILPVVSGPLQLDGITRGTDQNATRDGATLTVSVKSGPEPVDHGAWVLVLPAGSASGRPVASGLPGEPLSLPPGLYDVRIAAKQNAARYDGQVAGIHLGPGEHVRLAVGLLVASARITLGSGADRAAVDLVIRQPDGGRLVVRAPADEAVEIPPGDYLVDVVARSAEGSPLVSVAVHAGVGETVTVDVPRTGRGRLTVLVEGINGTGPLEEGVRIRAKGPAGETEIQSGTPVQLAEGDYTVEASLAVGGATPASVSRTVRVPGSGSARLTLTVPVTLGWIRVHAEGLPDGAGAACSVSLRTMNGVTRGNVGQWLTVAAGTIDVVARCPDRPDRRLPGLMVSGGDRQEHRVRWAQ